MRKWLEDVQDYSYNKLQIILLGNKCDLEDQREVSTDEGVQFATEFDLVFFEVSAYSGEYVEEAFMRAAADVYMGLITMKYDQDEQGDYIGIKKGNAEVPSSKRLRRISLSPLAS